MPKLPSLHRCGHWLLSGVLLLFLLGCGGKEPDQPLAVRPTGPIAAILIAGSDQQGVFDRARLAMADRLERLAPGRLDLVTLSAARNREPGARVATLAGIDTAMAAVAPQAAACFLFATSHGTRQGLVLTVEEEILTPTALDTLLDAHCAEKPTVAIISGCYSGVFTDEPMRAGNRILLTAAARNRISFGCAEDEVYTFYDTALLTLLPQATGWRSLHKALKATIAERERLLDEPFSRPQAIFGKKVPDDLIFRH